MQLAKKKSKKAIFKLSGSDIVKYLRIPDDNKGNKCGLGEQEGYCMSSGEGEPYITIACLSIASTCTSATIGVRCIVSSLSVFMFKIFMGILCVEVMGSI